MHSFRVLDASDGGERAEWITLWGSWPDREISVHPDYVRLFAHSCDRSLCAVLEDQGGTVLFPFVLRPLCSEEWTTSDSELCDLVTPYGYGGAFAWGKPDAEAFWTAFDDWASESKVVSCFARLSLFPEQMIPFAGNVDIKALNIVRTLDLDMKAIWMDYEHKVRKNVKKAQHNALDVQVDLDGSRLGAFLEIYCSTMERRNAAERYYFSEEFFQHITRNLAGHYALFYVLYKGRIVSTELVLISASHTYSFLGGTLSEAFDYRPNDLLKHAIIGWSKEHGKKAFVLGGGYANDDGVFHYKRSFAPRGIVHFRVGSRIYDPKTYASLIEQRLQWEMSQDREWDPSPGFFPAYRA